MAKKLYVVTLEVETLVYAASHEEAQRVGRQSMSDDLTMAHYGAEDCLAHEHIPGSALPDFWTDDLYPAGSDDRTVKEILDVCGKCGGSGWIPGRTTSLTNYYPAMRCGCQPEADGATPGDKNAE